MLKLGTSAAFVAASLAYFIMGFNYSFYTDDGRLGAGFFPRVVGGGMLLVALLNLLSEIRDREATEPNEYWKDILLIGGLMFAFVGTMQIIGAVPGMFLFILVVLHLLNPGRWATNIGLAVGLPVFIHLLFRVWLNAALPTGRFEIPLLS
jgi:putative tricarboxylic transport membrane protein